LINQIYQSQEGKNELLSNQVTTKHRT